MIDLLGGAGGGPGPAGAGPENLAIVVESGDDLTYADWERRSSALARGLARRGVGAGDRVALRFDAGRWAGFAVAYVGVLKAGAVAVLVPAGLASADAARVVRHSGAVGIVGPPPLAAASPGPWVADPLEVEGEVGGAGPLPDRPHVDPAATAELAYRLAPLARPRAVARTFGDVAARTGLVRPGGMVHAWAPGSSAGQHALASALAGSPAATLARFSPTGLCGLMARLGATTCGLTPALAEALVASGAAGSADVGSVTTVVLSRNDVGGGLRLHLATAFPRATVVELDEPAAAGPDADGEHGPTAASQVGMVWHEQLVPGSFNLPSLVRRYRGPLDPGALERALTELVRRHEPLRTTFELVSGDPSQVVRPPGSFALPVVDLGQLAPAARDIEVGRLVAQATGQPFDLVDEALFAPRLVRLGADDHVLIVRLHHTAFDDWSVEVFRRQLSALYSAEFGGVPSAPPPPATRFVDVCRRQQARLAGATGDEQRAYWRREMAGAPFAVQLRLGERSELGPDRPGAGEPVRHDLPPGLARDVRALAPRLRATPFMTALAAFGVLLARRTGQDDLVLASVVAGRGSTDLEPMIGCFTKKVLLRLRLGGDPTFAELVARSRVAVLGALAHADLPFEAVVQDTLGGPATAHGLAPQVPVVFQGETPHQARLVLPGVEVGGFEVAAAARRERHFSAAQAPPEAGPVWGDGAYLGTFLLLSLVESDPGLAFVARGVFSRPAAQELLQELEALLGDVAARPDARLSELVRGRRPAAGSDDLDLRGLRLSRSRIEAALRRCPGVAEVAVGIDRAEGGARLAAYVVPDRHPPPTLAELRRALWASLPGSPWPAAAVIVDSVPADHRLDMDGSPGRRPASPAPDPVADLLTSLWADAGGAPASPGSSYWQDFAFLRAVAAARAAGLPLTDEQLSRCRTPEMLAASMPPE